MRPFDTHQARPTDETLHALLRAHQDAVYNVCWQVLRQEQDAQDAAQRVLLRLIEELPRIPDEDHLRGWLYRASFRVALDLRKMRRRRMNHERNARPAAAADEETVERVHEVVAALDDDLRAIVAEHYFEQRPLADLALARGCSTTAVWKKLERAKEKLRESMSRAGTAALIPDLDRLLTGVRPVRAPKGLLASGSLATATIVSGIALKVKLIAACAVVAAGTLAYGALHFREERSVWTTPPAAPAARRISAPPPASPLQVADPPAERAPFPDPLNFLLAFQKAMEIPDAGSRWREYQRIGINLKDEDFRRAEAEIPVKHGTREYFSLAFGNILKVWLAADSARVIDLFLSLPSDRGLSREEARKAVLLNLAHYAPDAVCSYAKGLNDPELVGLLAPMTTSGARNAAVKADQLPKGDERTAALAKAVSDWANTDFRAAADWSETVLSKEEWKSMMWHALEQGGGRQNSRAAAEVALKIFQGKELYNLGVEHLVKSWCDTDPAAAGAFLLQLPVLEHLRDSMVVRVAASWAHRDPSAALLWAQQLPEREEALRAVGGAMVKSVRADPVQALGLVQTLPEKERRPAMEVIVAAWAELDPRAAAAVALSFPGGPVATDRVAQAWAAKDVEAAKAWAGTLAPQAREEALRAIENLRK